LLIRGGVGRKVAMGGEKNLLHSRRGGTLVTYSAKKKTYTQIEKTQVDNSKSI